MNKRPIEEARDSDLRLSMPAMLRAARLARELAASTGTAIVVVQQGKVVHLDPTATEEATKTMAMHAPAVGYCSGE